MKPNLTYRHSQFSTFFLAILSPFFLFDLILLFATRFALAPVIALFVLLFFMYTFSTLTIEVRKEQVSILFGPGMIHKTILFQDIENICIVDIHPRGESGIRWNPAYWIYNVSGDCAVEIELRGGDCLRIGSDEPEMLAKAIEDALIEMRKTA